MNRLRNSLGTGYSFDVIHKIKVIIFLRFINFWGIPPLFSHWRTEYGAYRIA